MKKIPFVLTLLLQHMINFSNSAQGFEAFSFINENADTLLYRMLAPAHTGDSKKIPLVLFLHGAGERGKDNVKQLTHGASLFLNELNREKFPAYVVFPQCPEEDYWASVKIDRSSMPLNLTFDYRQKITKSLSLVISLVKQLKEEKNIDENRIYVVGLSMGGMGTFEIIHREPDLFAAALPMCGGGDAQLFSKRAARIPMWIFHGEEDGVVSVQYSRDMVARIRKFNKSLRYTEYPETNHNSWDRAFAEPDLLSWLFLNEK